MKLAFMQNNDEQTFDGYLRGKLESAAPDMALLDSSFNTFLLERKEKKKKRRWFFWLFLFLPVFVIPFSYYIISHKGNFTNSKLDGNKVIMPIDAKNADNSLNTEPDELNKLPGSPFVKSEKASDSIPLDLVLRNLTRDSYKLPQESTTNKPSAVQQNNEYNKLIAADSVILFGNTSQKNVIRAIDSAMKKKDKPDTKVDTFTLI